MAAAVAFTSIPGLVTGAISKPLRSGQGIFNVAFVTVDKTLPSRNRTAFCIKITVQSLAAWACHKPTLLWISDTLILLLIQSQELTKVEFSGSGKPDYVNRCQQRPVNCVYSIQSKVNKLYQPWWVFTNDQTKVRYYCMYTILHNLLPVMFM